jgi:hypothetical protein
MREDRENRKVIRRKPGTYVYLNEKLEDGN